MFQPQKKDKLNVGISVQQAAIAKQLFARKRNITLDVSKIENIIINSINKVYGSHIGYITKQLKEDLIKHAENQK